MMKTLLDRSSQTDTEILLPAGSNGPVQLNISAFADAEKFGYEQLAVFVEGKQDQYGSSAVQGRHSIEGDYLSFTPYFPFDMGQTYVVRTKNSGLDRDYSFQSFQLGESQVADQAKLLSIYPTSDLLPENLLRFYIYFNTPMKKGQALKHIELTDETGTVDTHAFMEFKQELWSPDGKRLTILFDPGRIKRGVSTNMELGPALLEGNRYRLVISTTWQDVYGQPLFETISKEFMVGKPYRQHLEINKLKINKPKANSSEPLSIHFDRIIDHALAESMIQIQDEENNFIVGHWDIFEQERLIQFIPEESWPKGRYQIVFDSRLEDVAGNNLQSLLDRSVLHNEPAADSHQIIDFKLI